MEYYIDWFLYIITPWYSWDNLHLVMICNLFNMLLDQLSSVLSNISASIFIGYWLTVLPTILSFVMPWHVIKLCWNVIKVLGNMMWKQGDGMCRKGRKGDLKKKSADLLTSQFCQLYFLCPTTSAWLQPCAHTFRHSLLAVPLNSTAGMWHGHGQWAQWHTGPLYCVRCHLTIFPQLAQM